MTPMTEPSAAPAVPGGLNLLNLTPDEAERALVAFMREHGEPDYRARQVLHRLWQLPAADFASMSDLPRALRAHLAAVFELPRLAVDARQRSTDGTQKFLFRLRDNQAIEAVAIPEGDRLTLCVSSQAGCALRCAFCATGAMGFARNLEPFEIAAQVRELALLDPPLRPTNIVFMGMGEPLMNWGAVDVALTILNDPRGFGIGARHITVSTVGVLPGIVALGRRPQQFRLAISIHAPSDELRRALMPINVKYPLDDVIGAAREFTRRVTFEYVMLHDVNDQPEHARRLAALAKACGAFVNLIPLHPGGAGEFTPTPGHAIRRFAAELRRLGVEVAIRKSRGMDIAAACGQLRVERLRRRAPVRTQQHGDVEVARRIGPGLDPRPA
ncbi:MAG TPA: 23S rRNA (adenine(2503)-C(2))-methyltransferase RlmN [Gemmatimonadaceae bacterium]|nr:23S rRNA (adenine(2503)-C(2))-methyltransferase RlmN [Gemmatimonadaceae bacterium]